MAVTKKQSLGSLAKQVFELKGSGGDAILYLQNLIKEDKSLMQDALHQCCYDLLRQQSRIVRTVISHQVQEVASENPAPLPKRYTKQMQQDIQQACSRYMDWTMLDGSKIADANKNHLLVDADKYDTQAEGCTERAIFLRSVAEKLTDPRKKVSEVLKDDEIGYLLLKAKNRSK